MKLTGNLTQGTAYEFPVTATSQEATSASLLLDAVVKWSAHGGDAVRIPHIWVTRPLLLGLMKDSNPPFHAMRPSRSGRISWGCL